MHPCPLEYVDQVQCFECGAGKVHGGQRSLSPTSIPSVRRTMCLQPATALPNGVWGAKSWAGETRGGSR